MGFLVFFFLKILKIKNNLKKLFKKLLLQNITQHDVKQANSVDSILNVSLSLY